MLLSLSMFDNSYTNIVTITFTALIFSEMLNITTQVFSQFKISFMSFLVESSALFDGGLNWMFNYIIYVGDNFLEKSNKRLRNHIEIFI